MELPKVTYFRKRGTGWGRSNSHFGGGLSKYFEPRLPGVACEISNQFFALVQFASQRSRLVDKFAVGSLPKGLVVPSLTKPCIESVQDLVEIIKATLAKAAVDANRISLAIPDACVRVTIHPFEALPSKEKEKIELLKWKLKKTVPYDIDDSYLHFVEQQTETGKYYVITVNIHQDVLTQFEEVFELLGIHVGFITPTTFAAYELLARQYSSDIQQSVLFMRVSTSNVSSLIIQQGAVVFYRHIDLDFKELPDAEEKDSDLIWNQVSDPYDEIHPCLMYYQDKLGGASVDKIYLMCPQDLQEGALSSLMDRSKSSVSNFDPSQLFQWKHTTPFNSLKHTLSPALGLALRKF